MRSLIIYAPNVGAGGGLVLLLELLKANWPAFRRVAILDQRARTQIGNQAMSFDVHWSRSSLGGRWQAERLVSRLAVPGDLVLCFHNLPPVLRNDGRVFVYVQNAYLAGLIPVSNLRGWVRWRHLIERSIAWRFRHRVERYMVQTESMAVALAAWFGRGAPPIDILPFAADSANGGGTVASAAEQRWDFIYVSDGVQHKNHDRLFAAWELLAEKGLFPSLAVTLHPVRDIGLRHRLEAVVQRSGAQINDLGVLPHTEVLIAYRYAGASIFPSCAESFGLPLLEAKAAGLPILASELDYVRDLLDPEVTFDPTSVRSIARAVMRFLGVASGRREVPNAQGLVEAVVGYAGES